MRCIFQLYKRLTERNTEATIADLLNRLASLALTGSNTFWVKDPGQAFSKQIETKLRPPAWHTFTESARQLTFSKRRVQLWQPMYFLSAGFYYRKSRYLLAHRPQIDGRLSITRQTIFPTDTLINESLCFSVSRSTAARNKIIQILYNQSLIMV